MKNIILIVIGIIVGGMIVYGAAKNKPNNQESTKDSSKSASSINKTTSGNIGDDPYLGNKDTAKIGIIEFSDYECPYCKKFHDETFDLLVKTYVDNGKAILVFKDFALPFHKPAAIDDAVAANTVKDLAGNNKYFEFGKLLYANSQLNGKGLASDKIIELANKVGLNKDVFSKAMEANKERYQAEIDQDEVEGKKAGVSGTPAFIIGKLDKDGNINGELVVGAQPITAFQQVIDRQYN